MSPILFSKNVVKNAIRGIGFEIHRASPHSIKANVFNRKYEKKVLISFTKEPFLCGINYRHSVFLECYSAAEIFDARGYQVDVVDYSSEQVHDLREYHVFYGFGEPMEKSFYLYEEKPITRISYLNGCNPSYSNLVSALRVKRFYEDKGVLLPGSARLTHKSWRLQAIASDLLIVLGNSFVASTYLNENSMTNVRSLNAFFFDVFDIDLSQKDFDLARKHFLWFGSSGAIHKGLDLLIDIFSERCDIYLHICGLSPDEKDFLSFYDKTLENCQNIVNHGFIDITSQAFQKLMYLCGAVVFPSVSEGGAASVLNTLANGGLIPIISKSTGLDLENYGIVFEKTCSGVVEQKINGFMKLSKSAIEEMSYEVKKHVRDVYSYKEYLENLDKLIGSIIQQ